ncbi:Os04g0417600 [Oryza sativa Japonica Group]|uniref:OSJNBa0033G16.10 protein n=2 Tax=Oryza sativa subsp. japonica TaxID=39947 RepID=Q7XUZ0_ORYSJ|nr:Os04g0417600 [Oryza sativa Japonica Group]CAD40925.3 OSJNBa0033G16.10 [Oryza sativa Japonica Group]|eukprot:NP_001173930.1 Os04g0417600 [Oryza sativa Japonica Group]
MEFPSSTSPSPSPSSGQHQQQPTTPRRQLQGPRPPRLNVRMESHAIKKPSSGAAAAAAQAQAHQLPAQAQARREQQQPPPRAPVIIYDASPKIIHAKPNEFMALVQRLTGPGSGPPAPPHQGEAQAQDYPMMDEAAAQQFFPPELLLSPSAAMSPAARLATIERSVRPMPEPAPEYVDITNGGGGGGVDDGGLAAILGSIRPGILSPLPSSLPPAAVPGQFSPLPFDASCISWLNELSPILRAASAGAASSGSGGGGSGGNTSNGGAARPPPSYYADPFVPSPRHLLATPTVPSPATCAELFSNLPDL